MIVLWSHVIFKTLIKQGMLIISPHALMLLIMMTRFILPGQLFHKNLYTIFSNCFMNSPGGFGREIKRCTNLDIARDLIVVIRPNRSNASFLFAHTDTVSVNFRLYLELRIYFPYIVYFSTKSNT